MLLLFSVLSLGLTAYGWLDPQADLTVHIIFWVRLGCLFFFQVKCGRRPAIRLLWSYTSLKFSMGGKAAEMSCNGQNQRVSQWGRERKKKRKSTCIGWWSVQGVTSGWDCSPSWPRVLSSFSTWEDREWVDGLAIENVLWEVEIDSPFLPDKCPIWLRITTRGAYIPRATYGLSCCMWKYCKVATNRKTPQRNCDFFFFFRFRKQNNPQRR